MSSTSTTSASLTAGVPAAADALAATDRWDGAWTAAIMRPSGAPWFPTWAEQGFEDQSVRQVIRVNTGGSKLRIRLSNAYGDSPLHLTGACVGRTADGAAVRPGTIRTLRFAGLPSAALPARGGIVSDPIAFPTDPRERLTITLYFKGATGPASYHQVSMTTSYRATGDHHQDTSATAFTESVESGFGSWYYLEGVEVADVRPRPDAVVTFGDSITDGFGATVDGDDRWPDALAERLLAAGRSRPVLNAGIGSNKLLTDSACGGDAGVSRFARDVLEQPRIGTAIVLIGINDIQLHDDRMCGADGDDPPVTAERLVAGHRTLIRAAHARGVRTVGATLLPWGGSATWSADGEAIRDEVNEWIRTGGEYDAVADFDRALDPEGTGRLPDGLHMGDHLHPSPAGYRAMAGAIDLDTLK
ncbi:MULTISPECIES: SGNH/GDSL hydrolase family protein [unclassified Streptomyces]|uniref:SGNH/GDSL hydrolase family protein n=1 Tax=unclassified Streptomyces TaxID=2593676 RepID=UPI002442174C|nr:SGNH/GDSL hydrolase family protein [Streptomyces sp. DH41]MDG9726936.1 SGNH/GDSL hydrolase family protein [Streptomyces sp. DH41]